MAPKKGRKSKSSEKKNIIKRPRRPCLAKRVIVRFHDGVELPDEHDPDKVLDEHDPDKVLDEQMVGDLKELKRKFKDVEIRKLITALGPGELQGLVKKAKLRGSSFEYPNFQKYFAVNCPAGVAPQSVVKMLATWPTVQSAYVESGCSHAPLVKLSNNPKWKEQRYRRGAPVGINADYASDKPGGDGGGKSVGLQLIDIEQGWNLDHEDLPPGIELIHGFNRNRGSNDEGEHGTAVLGIVVGVNNHTGVVGITPHVTTMVASIWPDADAEDPDRVNAIASAIKRLNSGDVLLLELQIWAYGNYALAPEGTRPKMYNNLPVEVDDAVFSLIRLATDNGIIVVEAAGNAGMDLDEFEPRGNASTHWGEDSGAIMVAGSTAGPPRFRTHGRRYPTNYGTRVNCYAWGENICTTGYDEQAPRGKGYVPGFGDTSGASAIIAGAALALQGIAHANRLKGLPDGFGNRYSPSELRNILSDWTTGTVSEGSTPHLDPLNWNAERIGVMPDLKRIIDKVLPPT